MALPETSACAIEAVDAVIPTAVADRESADKIEAFPIENGTLYCFTRITGIAETTWSTMSGSGCSK